MSITGVATFLRKAIDDLESAAALMSRLEGTRDFNITVSNQIDQALKVAVLACEALED